MSIADRTLFFLAASGQTEGVKAQLEAGADANVFNGGALVTAAAFGHEATVKELLAAGADPAAFGGKALIAAVTNGHRGVVDALLATQPPVELVERAAHLALDPQGGRSRGVEATKKEDLILPLLAHLDARGHATALCHLIHSAARAGRADLLDTLLDLYPRRGAVPARPADGAPSFLDQALDQVASSTPGIGFGNAGPDYTDTIKVLVARGARPRDGSAAVLWAKAGKVETARRLLDAREPLRADDTHALLRCAAEHRNIYLARDVLARLPPDDTIGSTQQNTEIRTAVAAASPALLRIAFGIYN